MLLLDKNGLTEDEFLKSYDSSRYPKPSLTADVILLADMQDGMHVLLIRRAGHPCIGQWAFPGGFAESSESIEQTAARELYEETGIKNAQLIPVGLFSKPGRDKRGWVVSQCFVSVISNGTGACAGDDAAEVGWFSLRLTEKTIILTGGNAEMVIGYGRADGEVYAKPLSEDALAFDHAEMLVRALISINKIRI